MGEISYPTEATPEQIEVIEHFLALAVPGDWYAKMHRATRCLVVVMIGADFVWRFAVAQDGNYFCHEASRGEWQSGITC
jgi:hypothetical protein